MGAGGRGLWTGGGRGGTLSTDRLAAGRRRRSARDARRVDTPLHRYAAAHDGVVTRRIACALGYDWPALRTILHDEGWSRVGRGTYALPGTPPSLRLRVRAEQLARPALVASHRTATRLLGGDVLVDGLDFLVESDSRYDVAGGVVRRTRWCDGDLHDLDGLLVTSPTRTATDLLRARPRNEAVVAVDSLLRAGLVRLDGIAAALGRLRGERCVARAWSSFRRLDPLSGSVAESLARLVLWDAGLFPRTQVTLLDRAGRRVRVDFWFPSGVVVEVEGLAFHGSREQHQADMDRFNALARLRDQTVLRFSWADVVYRPAATVAAVRSALATRERWSRTTAAALPVSTDVRTYR
jgi:very-short-patch-repair endonuclease